MNKKRYGSILFIVFFLIILSSCNLFVSPPSLRENPNDDARQITGFTAVPLSDTSVMTMWNWITPQGWLDNDERIEEIKIIHSTLGYPEFNIPFVGQTYTDKSKWQFEWKNLASGTTHYFSFFAKDANGSWHSSYKMKVSLPGTVRSSLQFSRVNSLNIDDTGNEEWYPDSVLEMGPSKWAVLWLDIPDDVYVSRATITMLLISGSITDIEFVPLDGSLTGDGTNKWNSLAAGTVLRESEQVTFSSNLGTFDITPVIRAAVAGSQHAILIKTTASSFNLDNDASAPFITADVIE